jgi:probable rRNA maturation factor
MMTTSIDPKYENLIHPDLLERAALAVLDLQSASPDVEFTIVITDDAEIQQLNSQFLGIDSPTDVLSFPSDEIDPETQLHYLGDIIISYPTALRQAENVHESIQDEIQLLVIHGVLHLLGFDHAEPDEKREMWENQQNALDRLGCKISHLPE